MGEASRRNYVLELNPPEPSPEDVEIVTDQLGRRPRGSFRVVVRSHSGEPVVIRNRPHLHDGTPMPTLYWLTGQAEIRAVGRLESKGGVDRAEAEVDPLLVEQAHERYARERDSLLAADDGAPAPSGGVGGTRRGVKCLHAHYAYYLAGGDDPVGRWVEEHLQEAGE